MSQPVLYPVDIVQCIDIKKPMGAGQTLSSRSPMVRPVPFGVINLKILYESPR